MVDVVDIVNQGLRDAGVPYRIADIFEGSEAAKIALEIFGQSRDELLRTADWSFSRRYTPLTLLKGPPPAGGYNPIQYWSNLYPNPPFLFSYQYPPDCLDFRAVEFPPTFLPDLDPLWAEWRIDDDPLPNVASGVAVGPPAKVILCNINQAAGIYRAQITDPSLWDTGFIRAMVSSLGMKFSTAFGADVTAIKEQTAEAAVAQEVGSDVRG